MFPQYPIDASHKGLSPCDFDLIPKMKEPLRGIRFRTVPEILQAVDRSIRNINTTDAAKGILRLPHRWQRVVQILKYGTQHIFYVLNMTDSA